MVDFSNISKLEVTGEHTAEYVFEGLHGQPKVRVRPITRANKSYTNAMLKRLAPSKKNKNTNITVDDIERHQKWDLDLFPKYVLTDWEGVVDTDGNEVEFTEVNAAAFVKALPADMFDELREYCADISNFRDLLDVEDLAKN